MKLATCSVFRPFIASTTRHLTPVVVSIMDPSSVAKLKEFIKLVESQPELLHSPELAFFKKYLTSLGATVPKAAAHHDHGHAEHGHAHAEHEHQHTGGCCGGGGGGGGGHDHEHGHGHGTKEPEEPEEVDEPEEEDPDLMPPDNDAPQEMGPTGDVEPSDADMEKATEHKMAAAEAASNGEHAKVREASGGPSPHP